MSVNAVNAAPDEPSSAMVLPTYADVEAAARRLKGVAHRTPVLTSRTADERTGARLFFKAENLQRAGAFKFRGAYNAIAALSEAKRARGVFAFSSGNHAQAIALASRLLGVSATILMPEDSPAAKLAATQGYGAAIVTYDRYREDRETLARTHAQERGLAVVPPYDRLEVIAGQGTAAKELIEETGPLDLLLVCLGGGGLTAGSALSAAHLSPGCEVWGVEPEAGDDGRRSLEKGEIVAIAVPRTIADGAQTTRLGDLTFPIIRDRAAGIVTVADGELVETMRFFGERMKLVVEPTGCLAAAAAFGGRIDLAGKKVGVIISGGNVDLNRWGELVAG